MRVSPVLLAVLALAAAQPAGGQARGGDRVAVINSQVLLDSMPGRTGAALELEREQARVHRLIQEASDSLRTAAERFSQQEARLTPRMREAAMMQLRARELALEDLVAQLDAGANQRVDELRAPFLQRIREAVRVVRQREGVALVLDLATATNIVDADGALDLTTRVLAELRKREPGAASAGGERSPR